jgi:hypothetical protein
MRDSSEESQTSGTLHLVERGPTWLRVRVTGCFDDKLCAEFISAIDHWRGSRKGVTVFQDMSGTADYEVGARDRISRWAKEQVPYFSSVHVLVNQRTLAWAVDIIAMVSRLKLVTYHSADAFEAAYDQFRKTG